MRKKTKKMKHNKKRNTAFLYEILVRELTKSVLKEDAGKKKKVLALFKKHFFKGGILAKEAELYRAIYETKNVEFYTAEKLIYETRAQYLQIPKEDIFGKQSELIKDMNKYISADVFSNYVPNYKSLATISQIFNIDSPVKNRVLLEKSLLDNMVLEESSSGSPDKEIDDVVYRSFVKKYNSGYSSLLSEQKEVINKYLMSFSDNGLSLKAYLNEEVGRLKEVVKKSFGLKEIKEDSNMKKAVNEVMDILESFKKYPINEEALKKILKIQSFVSEAKS